MIKLATSRKLTQKRNYSIKLATSVPEKTKVSFHHRAHKEHRETLAILSGYLYTLSAEFVFLCILPAQ